MPPNNVLSFLEDPPPPPPPPPRSVEVLVSSSSVSVVVVIVVEPVENVEAVFVSITKLFPELILHACGNDVGILIF